MRCTSNKHIYTAQFICKLLLTDIYIYIPLLKIAYFVATKGTKHTFLCLCDHGMTFGETFPTERLRVITTKTETHT